MNTKSFTKIFKNNKFKIYNTIYKLLKKKKKNSGIPKSLAFSSYSWNPRTLQDANQKGLPRLDLISPSQKVSPTATRHANEIWSLLNIMVPNLLICALDICFHFNKIWNCFSSFFFLQRYKIIIAASQTIQFVQMCGAIGIIIIRYIQRIKNLYVHRNIYIYI